MGGNVSDSDVHRIQLKLVDGSTWLNFKGNVSMFEPVVEPFVDSFFVSGGCLAQRFPP